MAIKHSTGLRNWMITNGFDTAFDTNGRIAFYTGASILTADASATGTLLATLTMSSNAFGAPAAGVATAQAITSACAVAAGSVGYFFIYLSTETALSSSALVTDKRLIGTAGSTGTGSDMTFDQNVWSASGTVAVTSLTWTAPA
jgi:hypothetical protein